MKLNKPSIYSIRNSYIAYITAGHRGLEFTKESAIALSNNGIDILEIGIPFSDPIADGPVIQEAMIDALQRDTNITGIINTIKEIKKKVTLPIIIFSYFNPIISFGINNFFSMISEANVEAILIVDLPLEESDTYLYFCAKYKIEPIFLLSPSTPIRRAKEIMKSSNSFLYYVCRNGITGIKTSLPSDYTKKIGTLRSLSNIPIVTGFGISSKNMAKEALTHADGFVVGSTFVNAITNGANINELSSLARSIDPR